MTRSWEVAQRTSVTKRGRHWWSWFALRQMEKAVQLVQRSASLRITEILPLSGRLSQSFFPCWLKKHKHSLTLSVHRPTWCFMHFHFLFHVFDIFLTATDLSLLLLPIKQTGCSLLLPAQTQIGDDSCRWDGWTGQSRPLKVGYTWCSLVMVYMTDGGVTAKSTCLPHTPRQGGPVISYISPAFLYLFLEEEVGVLKPILKYFGWDFSSRTKYSRCEHATYCNKYCRSDFYITAMNRNRK